MFEEIITDAAELLAEKQLGLDQKKDSDKRNLSEMLVSFRQIFENELTEQFLKVCATMKFKYEIKKLAPETLHTIAIGIKDIVEDAVKSGNTVSISNIFQNKAIIEVAEQGCSEQKRKESNIVINPENTSENANENKKNTEEKVKTKEQAEKILGGTSKTLAKASKIMKEINEENIEQKVEELRELLKTEEAQAEERQESEALKYYIDNGTEEEKNQAQDALNNKKERNERRKKTSEEQRDTRSNVSGILFGFMKDAYNPIYSRKFDQNRWLEITREKILIEIMIDGAFSNEEKLALKSQLEKSSSIDEVTRILAQKMSELAVERGEEPIDIASLQKNARESVQPRVYKDIEVDDELKSRDIILSEKYAQMFFDKTDRQRVSQFIKQINSNNPDETYDFEILDKIKRVDKDFYYSMLRNISVAAREHKNDFLQDKFDELIDKDVGEQLYEQNHEQVVMAREKLTPEEQRNGKVGVIGVLNNFLIAVYHSEKSIDRLKKELEVFLTKDNAFTNEEKNEFIEKIRNVDSVEEYQHEVLEKMDELAIEYGNGKFDKERVLKSSQRFSKLSDLQRAKARAKIVFDEGLYNRYLEFQHDLINGKKDGVYDLELLYMLKQRQDVEPYVYDVLMKYVKKVATIKNDSNLMRIYKNFQLTDREDEVVEQEEQEMKRKIEDRNQKIELAKSKVREERNNLTEEELNEARKREPVLLFGMLIEICEEKPERNIEILKEKIFDFIGNQIALSDDEKERILIDVYDAKENYELEKKIAEKILELSQERGIPDLLRDPNKIISRAKKRTLTKNYKSLREETKVHEAIPSKIYAVMFCEEDDRKEIFKLIKNLTSDNPKLPLDLSVLEKIEKIDKSFYYSMIRNVGVAVRNTNDEELKETFKSLVTNEVIKQTGRDSNDFDSTNVKAQILFEERLYNRYSNAVQEIIQGSLDGVYDIDLIEMVRERNVEIYEALMSNIDKISRQRDDNNLRTVYDMFRKKDEKEQTQEMNDDRREIKIDTEPDTHKKVGKLEVENIFVAPEVSEIVESHTDSERLVRREKNQLDDIVGEGR